MSRIHLLKQTQDVSKEADISSLEIKFPRIDLDELKEAGRIVWENGHPIRSVHLPFRMNRESPEDIRRYINTLLMEIPTTKYPTLIIHAFEEGSEEEYVGVMSYPQSAFVKPIWLCHENFYGRTRLLRGFDNIDKYRQYFTKDQINKICYDVSHKFCTLDELVDVVSTNRDLIKHLSISNFNAAAGREHMSIFDPDGDIDYTVFLEKLKGIFTDADINVTLEYSRPFRGKMEEDFKRAKEILDSP